MRSNAETTRNHNEWTENGDNEDFEATVRNSQTIESLIESLIERDSINSTKDDKLGTQFYSIILPIFFFFFVSCCCMLVLQLRMM